MCTKWLHEHERLSQACLTESPKLQHRALCAHCCHVHIRWNYFFIVCMPESSVSSTSCITISGANSLKHDEKDKEIIEFTSIAFSSLHYVVSLLALLLGQIRPRPLFERKMSPSVVICAHFSQFCSTYPEGPHCHKKEKPVVHTSSSSSSGRYLF